MLFTEEVTNLDEFIDIIEPLNIGDKFKIAVVCFLFDRSGKLILQRRGPGARDEIGKLEAIGGSINNNDINFRQAMKRELQEEAGTNAKIVIDSFIGAQKDEKVDKHTGEMTSWIVLAYKGTLISGNLVNAEPDRCVGFEKADLNGFKDEDVAETARNFIKYMSSKR